MAEYDHEEGSARFARNQARWDAMRARTEAAKRADRISRGLSVTPPATPEERRRFAQATGDVAVNHKMIVVGEMVLRQTLDALPRLPVPITIGNPDPPLPALIPTDFNYAQLAIDIYKAMLKQSVRVDRNGRKRLG